MASLRKLPDSKNFIACFTDANGRRLQRSTGTNNRQKALSIAIEYEAAARQIKTEAQIRRVLSDLYERVSGTPLPSGSIQAFLQGWVKRKEVENANKTAAKYRETVERFLRVLGERAALDLNYLRPADILAFRDAEMDRVSVTTVNLSLKILRIALNQAKREGLIQVNPAAQVMGIKRKNQEASRRPFTLQELRSVLDAADEEWKGMIAFGYYTAQRLGDIACLTWSNIDVESREVRFAVSKTGQRRIKPLLPPLLSFISKLPSANAPKAPLFPRAYEIMERFDDSGMLSNRFRRILVRAGLAQPRSHKKKADGKGRSGKREVSELSFHCLRHTSTTHLKKEGASQAVAMELIGHDSESISQHYTHIDMETLRKAGELLPDIFAEVEP